MSCIRPRTFLSPLQVGLSVMLHRKFAKRIIDILSHLGVCSSYKEATLYEDSVLLSPRSPFRSGCFAQLAFANSDININTIDEKNTFHSMGGIMIVSPRDCYYNKVPLKRLTVKPTAKEISKIDKIPFQIFENINTHARI